MSKRSINPLSIVCCRGEPYQIGFEHGRSLANDVRNNLTSFWAMLEEMNLSRSLLMKETRRLAADLREEARLELNGIADGAEVARTHVYSYNLLRHILLAEECSVLGAMNDSTADGRVIMLKNSDKIGSQSFTGPTFYNYKEINVILDLHDRDEAYVHFPPDRISLLAVD